MAPKLRRLFYRLAYLTIVITFSGYTALSIAEPMSTFAVSKNPVAVWAEGISKASRSILIVEYKFSAKNAVEAVVSARKRGVNVTIILDGFEATKNAKQVAAVQQAGAEVFFWPTDPDGELHAKFTIIDEKVLILGSFNLSKAAVKNNTESYLTSTDPEVVSQSLVEFRNLLTKVIRQP